MALAPLLQQLQAKDSAPVLAPDGQQREPGSRGGRPQTPAEAVPQADVAKPGSPAEAAEELKAEDLKSATVCTQSAGMVGWKWERGASGCVSLWGG